MASGWNIAHFVTSSLALLLGAVSFFVFTRSKSSPAELRGTRKAKRNQICRACGIIIGVDLVLAAALSKTSVHMLFWWESIAVLAFSFSWLVKGGVLLKDQ
jgi:hypothetical protein